MSDIIIGIDLGTTNSLVAYCDESGPRCLHPRETQGSADERELLSPLVPSVVFFAPDGRRIVGQEARRQAVAHPTQTVFSIKRLMGIGWDKARPELPFLPYRVVPGHEIPGGSSDIVYIQANQEFLTPQEISAMVLREVKRRADEYFGQDVRKAVITVPAYFDDSQRQATRDAGRIAGLEVLRIVNEPTAAALAYGLGLRNPTGTVAVYDLGGGTFDISILAIESGVFQVLATHGDTHLGGDDVDREIIALVQREIRSEFGTELAFPPSTQQALRDFAEATKIHLSTYPAATLELDLGADAAGQPRVYRRVLKRAELEALIDPWIDKTLAHCQKALTDAGKTLSEIEEVVLVGGMTRIPRVRQKVETFFGRTPYTAVNPDEVVALGAAVQASILAGIRQDTLLLDVIPLSLGIETMGGAFGKLITAQTRIPAQAAELFTTYVDGQTNVKIHVLQGERELARDCRSLGQFELRGIPPMPCGLPKIRVSFLVDANGILNVSAKEERSGTVASIQVLPSHGLTPAQVEKMTEESYEHAIEDMLIHRLIDLRNQVDVDVRAIRKSLAMAGEQLPAEERAGIEALIHKVQTLARTNNADAIHTALAELDRRTMRLAELAIAESLRRQM